MERTLVYYSLKLEKTKQTNLFDNQQTTLQDKAEELSTKNDKTEMTYKNLERSFIIEIESIARDYIFGSFGKLENFSNHDFMRGRRKEDYNLSELEDLVESYTYFYLDLDTNKIVVLYNYKCKGFKKAFSLFLQNHFRVTSIYNDIKVVHQINENIPQTIGKSTNFLHINFSYTSDRSPENNYLGFDEMFGVKNNDVKSASVQLYLDPTTDKEGVRQKLKELSLFKKDKFNTFKIDTDEEVIDVIENRLSKKISIEINDNDINNINKIKELLKKQLPNY